MATPRAFTLQISVQSFKDHMTAVSSSNEVIVSLSFLSFYLQASFSQYARPGSGLKILPNHVYPNHKGKTPNEYIMGYTVRSDQVRHVCL